jgi:hypothetical protein
MPILTAWFAPCCAKADVAKRRPHKAAVDNSPNFINASQILIWAHAILEAEAEPDNLSA